MDNGVITFNVERVNVGGAMKMASGVFTAPVNGTYHFDFAVIIDGTSDFLVIILQVNGIDCDRVHANTGKIAAAASLTASLRLKVRDRLVLNNK